MPSKKPPRWEDLEGPAHLKKWREKSKLSQQDAAALIGIDLTAYNAFERGRRRPGIDIAATMETVTKGRVQITDWAKRLDDETRRVNAKAS